jgi:putative methionine-R-sulfoxide reductase with GAF domain
MNDKKGRASPSDPPEDLKKERDAFIQQFFRKGAQLTEEVLKENERLRERIAELEGENGRMRAHLASDEAIRDLLRKIEELEAEKTALLHRSVQMEQVTDKFSARYSEVDDALSNLANLYVATSQLHSSPSVRNVLRNLKEMLAQLVGAASFGIYLVSNDGNELVAIASEGSNFADVARLPVEEGPVGRAFLTAELFYDRTNDVSKGSVAKPAAVVPLRLDGKAIGVIAIFATLSQKTGFGDEDSQLFQLLGAQAAPALVHARLFTDAGRKVPSVQAFLDLED